MTCPPDELILAKMIQSAKARGLRACRGPAYDDLDTPSACCALGAWWLGGVNCLPPTIDGEVVGGIASGNDMPDADWVGDGPGADIGRAFQDAMEEE